VQALWHEAILVDIHDAIAWAPVRHELFWGDTLPNDDKSGQPVRTEITRAAVGGGETMAPNCPAFD